MQNKQSKQRRIFEITGVQIWIGLIIVALALTIVFEVGVLVGKKRVIKAEMEAARQYDMQMRAATKTSTEARLPHRSLSDQATEPLEAGRNTETEAARRDDIQPGAASETSTGGGLLDTSPRDQTDQSAEQLDVGDKEYQYTIQVGTFGFRQNAENMVNLLRSYEYESWSSSEADEEKTLYCVFIGRFDTRDEAEQFGRSIRETLSYVTEYRVSKIQE